VLVSRGEYDEVTPGSAQQLAAALPSTRGQVNTCAGSGSYVHIGESRKSAMWASWR
jgi:hypothetical protein